ncbi:MAG: hypothetical protein JO366_13770 [Methylobacteriaceae bacterium]|nr:hypothetical protein [Methylobacteriaceae bacterium]
MKAPALEGSGLSFADEFHAAAAAALMALEKECSGVYDIAEQNGYLSIARRELGFDPDFRLDC